MSAQAIVYNLIARDSASRTFEHVGRSAGGLEKGLGRLGKAAAAAGTAMAAALAVAAVESAKKAMEFQASMTKISTQAGGTAKDVKVLSDQVLKLGTTTQQGPQKLSEALYHLKSVGMDNANAMKALKQASDLAAVGGADLEETTNALAGAWRTGIKGASTFSQAAGTVNAVIGAGNMKMEDFVGAIGTGILPAAKTFGLSLQQVGAAIALFTDEGVPATDAATRLRMSFSLLGAPSAKADKVLKGIGLTGLKLAEAMRSKGGLIAAVQMLKDHLEHSGKSASEQAQILSHAFGGGRSSGAIMSMVNNLDVLKQKQEQVNRTIGKFPSAVEQQRKTASAQWKLLTSNLEVLTVKAGVVLLPPLTTFLHFLTSSVLPGIGKVTKALKAMVPTSALASAFGTAKKSLSGFFSGLSGPKKKTPAAVLPIEFGAVKSAPAPLPIDFGAVKGPAVPKVSGAQKLGSQVAAGAKALASQAASQLKRLQPLVAQTTALLTTIAKTALPVVTTAFRTLGQIIGRYVVPSIVNVGRFLAPLIGDLRPLVTLAGVLLTGALKVAGVALAGVGIALRAVTGWMAKNHTAVTSLALIIGVFTAGMAIMKAGLIGTRIALIALAVQQKIVAVATRAWAIAQAALDVVMNANPIGIVITAVAALAAGFIYAWKHSETFRDIVKGALNGIATAGSWMWNKVLKPVFRFMVNAWLAVSGALVHGAATAFGWIPGLGGKLKSAAKKFDDFKAAVNKSLSGVKSKTVSTNVKLTAVPGGGHFATGGPVFGPGTATSDSIPARLSRGEHVLTAREVRGAGGHGAVMSMRQGWAKAPAFATGGAVGLNVAAHTPSKAAISNKINTAVKQLVDKNAKAMFASLAQESTSGSASGVQNWRGVVLQALSLLHQSPKWLNTVLRRMNQESGGNPTIVNKWDSNWKAGHPSVGLMQVIGPTFRSWAGFLRVMGPFLYGTSVNPLANVYAGLNYAIHRYGSLSALNRPGGYAAGTPGAAPGWAWVGERGPELVRFKGGETVRNHGDSLQLAAVHGLRPPGYATGTVLNAQDRVARDKRRVAADKAAVARTRRHTKARLAADKRLAAAEKELKAAEISLANAKRSAALSAAKARATAKKSITTTLATGFLKTLETGTASAIGSAIKSLATKLINAGYVKTGKSTQAAGAKLQSLATKKASIASQISAATQYASDQASSITDYLSISGTSASSVGDLISQMQSQQKTAASFAALAKSLRDRGASKGLLSQLSSAGVGSQLAVLLGDKSLTTNDIAQLNALTANGSRLATSFGNTMADAMYDSGKDASKGFLAGLKSQEKALSAEMAKLATALVKNIKKVLKIKSPSQVMRDEVGKNVALGMAHGIDRHRHLVGAAARRMADVATGISTRPAFVPTAGNGGGAVAGRQEEAWGRLAAALENLQGTELHVHFDDETLKNLIDVRVKQRQDRAQFRQRVGRR